VPVDLPEVACSRQHSTATQNIERHISVLFTSLLTSATNISI
jgi:hypothetical protein